MKTKSAPTAVATILAVGLATASIAADAADLPSPVVLAGGAHEVTIPHVERALRDLGFADIGPIAKDGRIFEAAATWQGEAVALRINAATGQVTDASAVPRRPAIPSPVRLASAGHETTIPQMREALSRLGYENVRDVEQDGTIFAARAQLNGRDMALRIDADTGRVATAGRTRARASDPASSIRLVSAGHEVTTFEVVQALGHAGYRDVRDVAKDGRIFAARADWQGRDLSIRIDAGTGQVTER